MKLERHVPTASLKPFINEFLLIESSTGTENRVVPDTSIVMAFQYKGTVTDTTYHQGQRLPKSGISGLRKSSRLLRYAAGTATLLVLFKEGGAARFFREPLHELFGVSLPLDDLIYRQDLSDVEERLAEATNNHQRIAIVERFLLSRMLASGPEQLITRAVETIKTTNGNTGIKTLVQSLCISQDAFEKRFRREVGTTPKQFATIVRFRHLIGTHSPGLRLTNLAYEAGYFDQAHFIKDFRSFTSQTPHDFFNSSSYW